MTLKELRESIGKHNAEIQKFRAIVSGDDDEKARMLTAEEDVRWKEVNADYDATARKIEILERADVIDKRSTARVGDPNVGREDIGLHGCEHDPIGRAGGDQTSAVEDRSLAMAGWMCAKRAGGASDAQRDAAQRIGFNIQSDELHFDLARSNEVAQIQDAFNAVHPTQAKRALSGVSIDSGGALVPEGFIPRLEVAMLAFGGMLQTAEIIRTDQGNDIPWPTANDTGNTGRRIAESAAVATDVEPTFSQIVFHAYKYTSDEILIPSELLEDSAFDLPSLIAGMLGERLGRILNTECTTGDGNSQPYGIVNASTLGVTTASATAFTLDEIAALIASIEPAYVIGSRFMCNSAITLALRLLKDGEGRPLWQSNAREGMPDTIYGYPMTINQDMASTIESGAKTLLFGQLSAYKIREVRGVRLYRLVERHRPEDQDGFLAFVRRDGNLIDAGTHPVKYLQQA